MVVGVEYKNLKKYKKRGFELMVREKNATETQQNKDIFANIEFITN